MDKIQVTGEYLYGKVENDKLIRATIELTPPTRAELDKLKDGDKVLIEATFHHQGNVYTYDNYRVCVDKIVAILPHPETLPIKPQEEFEEISEMKREIHPMINPDYVIIINALIRNQCKIINTLKTMEKR